MTAIGWCLTGAAFWIVIVLFVLCLCRAAASADARIEEALKKEGLK